MFFVPLGCKGQQQIRITRSLHVPSGGRVTYNGEVALEVSVWDYDAHQKSRFLRLVCPCGGMVLAPEAIFASQHVRYPCKLDGLTCPILLALRIDGPPTHFWRQELCRWNSSAAATMV